MADADVTDSKRRRNNVTITSCEPGSTRKKLSPFKLVSWNFHGQKETAFKTTVMTADTPVQI
jgi:hypothetical protein